VVKNGIKWEIKKYCPVRDTRGIFLENGKIAPAGVVIQGLFYTESRSREGVKSYIILYDLYYIGSRTPREGGDESNTRSFSARQKKPSVVVEGNDQFINASFFLVFQ
jgi:hypothetical protein